MAGGLALVSVTYVSAEKATLPRVAETAGAESAPPGWAGVEQIFTKHCISCHAVHPTSEAFKSPPLGVMLDSYEHARSFAPRVKKVAVDAEIMPLGNMTGMTRAERDTIGRWIAAGAPQ